MNLKLKSLYHWLTKSHHDLPGLRFGKPTNFVSKAEDDSKNPLEKLTAGNC